MTARVDHTRDHDLTVVGCQAACGWALHLILTETHRLTGKPLPILSGVIREDEPRLAGLVVLGTARQCRAAVNAWATHLNAKPQTVDTGDDRPRFEVDAIAHGVEVHIHTYLDAAPKEVAA